MAQDHLIAVERCAVMPQPVAAAHAPKRRRADLITSRLSAVLDDAVAGSHVVQQEVAERADALIAERRRYREIAAVDHRARSGGDDLGGVTDAAADGVEDAGAGDGVR